MNPNEVRKAFTELQQQELASDTFGSTQYELLIGLALICGELEEARFALKRCPVALPLVADVVAHCWRREYDSAWRVAQRLRLSDVPLQATLVDVVLDRYAARLEGCGQGSASAVASALGIAVDLVSAALERARPFRVLRQLCDERQAASLLTTIGTIGRYSIAVAHAPDVLA